MNFECLKSIRNYEKKILGTSDAWSPSRLSHWPSEQEYYIVDCRIYTERNRHRYRIKCFLIGYNHAIMLHFLSRILNVERIYKKKGSQSSF